MSAGQFAATAGTNPVQDVTSTGGTNAYCLAAPAAGTASGTTATFASVVTTTTGTLSVVPGSSLTPTNFPAVTSNDPDTCYNPLVAGSTFTAVGNTAI
jgi:hypothetical protein